jgi:EF-P beta-lysylation protein EpmB
MIAEALPKPAPPSATEIDQPQAERPAWMVEAARAYTDPAALAAALGLSEQLPLAVTGDAARFSFRVPRPYAARMRYGDLNDPLLRQVWPSAEENRKAPGFSLDAVGDLAVLRNGGVLHKYEARALLITTGACAVHCRYCFRRHFPYGEALASRDQWRPALETLRGDPSIHEVILSGGDPLSLSDERLARLAGELATIPHLRRFRMHTRQPVVLPNRIDDALLAWLSALPMARSVVLHINHANEIDEALARACAALRDIGVTLLNQSVLLAGVNDSVGALADLSERLFDIGVLPYYLHMLDPVEGATHFDVSAPIAQELMRGLQNRLPGYLVPKLVREEKGMPAKTPMPW